MILKGSLVRRGEAPLQFGGARAQHQLLVSDEAKSGDLAYLRLRILQVLEQEVLDDLHALFEADWIELEQDQEEVARNP